MKRLVKRLSCGNQHAAIYFDTDGEYIVFECDANGKQLDTGYYTDDKADAYDTAEFILSW